MNKKLWDAPIEGVPSQTETSTSKNRHDGYGCQASKEESATMTPPNDQIGSCQALRLKTGHSDMTLAQPSRTAFPTRNSRTPTTGKAIPEPLPTRFKSRGFDYKQIAREGNIAIYEQRWRSSENVGYEVVRIRVRTHRFKSDGRPYEAYPGSGEWGLYGFTLTDKDAAFTKLRQLSPAEPAKPTGTGRRRTGTGNKHKLKPSLRMVMVARTGRLPTEALSSGALSSVRKVRMV